ncbi:exodeoxyribonuclease VII [Lampropedia cohaerens]|uniref:Exodeoxyribonuclease 7 large subunit n=1 Tax=Lampropedia cohaerens TaxID=1610491 RepID=A0A0U1PYP3_9BURK|nr:exodeoxyribonuclease VII large subunit [Lampropedia cohaerens]KKW67643.1 exodeoxyribonuclease VII [Lampropedia cohaerens]
MTEQTHTRVWPVGALCVAVADALHARFNPVAVEGEISGFSRAGSGHLYFSLKDETGQLRCAMFRRAVSLLGFMPREGERVVVRGRLGVYEARGDLQLVVESLQRSGQGNLYEQFLQLKEQLQREGLFDPARKRVPVPIPRAIAVVTSPNAAAWQDVATTLARRAPHVPVLLFPALVQGAQAPAALCEALSRLYRYIAEGSLSARAEQGSAVTIDTILLVRGGGSIEDLWAFNDATLARLMVKSPVPIISGVGHETDVTIADWCADVRAPTPTAAAEMAAMDHGVLRARLQQLEQGLAQALDGQLIAQQRRLKQLAQTLARPGAVLSQRDARLRLLAQSLQHCRRQYLERRMHLVDGLESALRRAVQQSVQGQQNVLASVATRLRMLDPQRVLERGYAIVTRPDGCVVKNAAQLQTRDRVVVRFAKGQALLQRVDAPQASSGENGELF